MWFSGDPVANVGWIEDTSEGDLRNIISSGRFTLEANKPIDIWVGYVVGQGTNALNSISVTRNYVQNAQTYFNNNFTNGTVSDVDDDILLLTEYTLHQNYPNPFNPITNISYQIPTQQFITLKVFDILGNEIDLLVNEEKVAGYFETNFNASKFTSGVYFYQLKAGNYLSTKKMVYLK